MSGGGYIRTHMQIPKITREECAITFSYCDPYGYVEDRCKCRDLNVFNATPRSHRSRTYRGANVLEEKRKRTGNHQGPG